jgi:hypothetical protein
MASKFLVITPRRRSLQWIVSPKTEIKLLEISCKKFLLKIIIHADEKYSDFGNLSKKKKNEPGAISGISKYSGNPGAGSESSPC